MSSVPFALKRQIPWWAKVGLRLTAARLPVSYTFWRSLGLTKHGGMDPPEWAFDKFQRHYRSVDFPRKGDGFTLLELGPGDSLLTALLAKAHGAGAAHLVDVGPFATRDADPYHSMTRLLS